MADEIMQDEKDKLIAELSEKLEHANFLASIVDNIQDLVITTDVHAVITRWNHVAENLLEWKAEEVIGKTTAEILKVIYTDQNREQILESFAQKDYWQGEVIYHTKSGRPVYVLTTASRLKDPNGQITGSLILVRDITERKKAENELNRLNEELERRVKAQTEEVIKNEKRFRSLIENGADCVVILGADGVPTYTSSSVTKILGYTEEEAMNLNLFEIIHPDDIEGVYAKMKTVLEYPGITIPGHTSRTRHKDGTWRWLEANITNLLDDPDINGIVDNFRDITSRKELEDLLNKANKLARIGGWEVDMIKGKVYWSDITREIHETGLDFIPDLDSGINFYKEGKSRALITQKVNEAIETGKPWDVELQIITAKNNERWIRTIGETEFVDGKCVRIYGSFQDIDSRKRAEEEIKRLNEELEQRVIERTEKLTIANRELEQFAYVASHDLQEPLRTVSNYMKIFEEDYKDLLGNDGLKYLHSVNNAARRMSNLIQSLLDFSRLGHNSNLAYVDIKKVIQDAIADLHIIISTSDADIQISEMPMLNVYENEIRKVFQNLIVNAIKFQKEGVRPRIQIYATKVENIWQFSVKDNGIGINPVYFKKIFNIFQRLESRTNYEGNGIGLANCKKIIQIHKGEIWVESIPGKGSTFHFTIPYLS
ncbi:MAG: PAS domain S-box protein [Bacteroidia bacterium]